MCICHISIKHYLLTYLLTAIRARFGKKVKGRPPSWIKGGLLLTGGGGEGKRKGRGGKGRGGEGKGEEGKGGEERGRGMLRPSPFSNSWIRPCIRLSGRKVAIKLSD